MACCMDVATSCMDNIRLVAARKSIASRDRLIQDLRTQNKGLKEQVAVLTHILKMTEKQELSTRIELFETVLKTETRAAFHQEYSARLREAREALNLL